MTQWQFENFRIFLPLRSCVKSILPISESLKQLFLQFLRPLNFNLGQFQPTKNAKIHQNQTSVPQKMSKWHFCELIKFLNLISRNISVVVKFLNFHTVNFFFAIFRGTTSCQNRISRRLQVHKENPWNKPKKITLPIPCLQRQKALWPNLRILKNQL